MDAQALLQKTLGLDDRAERRSGEAYDHSAFKIQKNALMIKAQCYMRTVGGRTHNQVPMGTLGGHESRELVRLHRSLGGATKPDWSGRVTPQFQDQWCALLEEFSSTGGPRNIEEDDILRTEYTRIRGAAGEGRFSIEQLQRLIHAEGVKFLKSGPFYSMLFRTHGYAGSSAILEMMHENMGLATADASNPMLGYLRYCNNMQSTQAVRNRVLSATALAREEIERRMHAGERCHIASFASGTGRFANEVASSLPPEYLQSLSIDCYDVDPRATLVARRKLAKIAHSCSCSFQCRNLLSNRQFNVRALGANQLYDFAECAGLFDYLTTDISSKDRSAGRTKSPFAVVLRKMYETISPGGLLVVGNFAKDHPDQALMELSNWSLMLRNEQELEALVAEHAGLQLDMGDCLSLIRVPPGTTQILMLLRKGERPFSNRHGSATSSHRMASGS